MRSDTSRVFADAFQNIADEHAGGTRLRIRVQQGEVRLIGRDDPHPSRTEVPQHDLLDDLIRGEGAQSRDEYRVDRLGCNHAEEAEIAITSERFAGDPRVLTHRDEVVAMLGGMTANLLMLC